MKRNQILIATSLVLLAAVSRIVGAETHIYNFAPIISIGLLSGAILKDKRIAFLLALSGQFLADVYFQMYPTPINTGFYGISQFFTYAALIIATYMGTTMKNIKALTVLGYTLGASTMFFLVSNFGYFVQGWNGYTGGGLVKTYVDAIPFYKNSIIGDLSGSVVLFGLYYILQKAFSPKVQVA